MSKVTIPAGPITPFNAADYLSAAKSELVARAWYTESETAQSLTMHVGRHGGGNLAIGRKDVVKIITSDDHDEHESFVRVFDQVTVSVVDGEVGYELDIAGRYWRSALANPLYGLVMVVAASIVAQAGWKSGLFAGLSAVLVGFIAMRKVKQAREIGRELVESIHAAVVGALSLSDQSS